jgi:hypothetical protein
LWVVGRGLPDSVVASAVSTPSGVDVSCELELRWRADGDAPECVAQLYAGLNEAPRQWLRVEATAGWLDVPGKAFSDRFGEGSAVRVGRGGAGGSSGAPAAGVEELRFEPVDPYRLMFEAVSERAAGVPSWVVAVEESANVAVVLDAARAAAARHEPVAVPVA